MTGVNPIAIAPSDVLELTAMAPDMNIAPESILDQAEAIELCRRDLRFLAESLAANPDDLDRALRLACAERRAKAFTHLVLAALFDERDVDISHLEEGSVLFLEPQHLLLAVPRMSGDLYEAVAATVDHAALSADRALMLMLLALERWQRTETGEPFPPKLLAHARKLARRSCFYDPELLLQLWTIQTLTGDTAMEKALLDMKGSSIKNHPQVAEFVMATVREGITGMLWDSIPEAPAPRIATGFTVRRAVPRIGRNDPCPCGSGKKYKKCCQARDAERLKDSSEIAGVTRTELESRKEEFLTPERLWNMPSYELVKLDAHKISDDLFPVFINRLLSCEETERVVEIFEDPVLASKSPEHWIDAVESCRRERRHRHLADRLFRVCPAACDPEADLSLGSRVMRVIEDDPGAAFRLLEDAALRQVLSDEEHFHIAQEIAFSAMENNLPGLGILLARGALPLLHGLDREMLAEAIEETRVDLGVDINDPVEDVCDLLLASARSGTNAETARVEKENRRLIQQHVDETRALKKQLGELSAQLEARETALAKANERAKLEETDPGAKAADQAEATIRDLRARLREVKEDLHRRHRERNALRRELHQAKARQEPAQPGNTDSPEPPSIHSSDDEEIHLLTDAGSFKGTQPVRIPVFPTRFRKTLESLPAHVAAAALETVGRLSGGYPDAFAGVRKLKLRPNVLRQKVTASYRLLFEVTSETLQVVDLIHRRDLESRIKGL